jgi:hypothetical protein
MFTRSAEKIRLYCRVAGRTMTAAAIPIRSDASLAFVNYQMDHAYDEMFATVGVPREHYRALQQTLLGLAPEELRKIQQAADLTFLHEGITFTVYGIP